MKSLFPLVISFIFASQLFGQFYIKGIASDSIDRLYYSHDSLYDVSMQENTKRMEDLALYFKEQYVENPSKAILQNLAHLSFLKISNKYGVEGYSFKYDEEFNQLGDLILKELGEESISYAEFNKYKGYFLINAKKDFSASEKLLTKSIDQQLKLFEENHPDLAQTYSFIGELYTKSSEFEKGKVNFQRCLEILESHDMMSHYVYREAKGSLGTLYYREPNYEKAKEIYLSLYKEIKSSPRGTSSIEALILNNLGELTRKLDQYDEALKYGKLAKELMFKTYGMDSGNMSFAYSGLATSYYFLGDMEKVNLYLDSAIYILKRNSMTNNIAILYRSKAITSYNPNAKIQNFLEALEFCPDDPRCVDRTLVGIYNGLTKEYLKKGKTSLALNYLEKAKKVAEENPIETQERLMYTYQIIAKYHSNRKEYQLANKYFLKMDSIIVIRNKNSIDDGHVKAVVANSFLKINQVEKAKEYFSYAEKIISDFPDNSNKLIGDAYSEASKYCLGINEFDKALEYSKKTYDVYTQVYGARSPEMFRTKLTRAKIFLESNNKEKCRQILDDLLDQCGINFEKPSEINAQDYELWDQFQLFVDLIKLEQGLEKLNLDELESRIEYGINLTDRLRNQYFFISSELEFSKTIKQFFNYSIDQLYANINEGNTERIYSTLFACIEKNKSINLNRSYSRNLAMNSKAIPADVISKEKKLIFDYQKALEKYRDNEGAKGDSITQVLIDEMLSIQKEKRGFLDSLKLNHPKYYEQRYEQPIKSLAETKGYLKENQEAVLLFHASENHVYYFYLTPQISEFHKLPLNELKDTHGRLIQIMANHVNVNVETNYKGDKTEFIRLSRLLFDRYFDEIAMLPEKMTIVPDDFITAFPFEILLSDDVSTEANYKQLPYLLRKTAIAYQGSASQLFHEEQLDLKKPYIGFGPSYPSGQAKLRGGAEAVPPSLSYNTSEVEKSSQLFDGSSFINELATKDAFRLHAKNSEILHMAMHAQVDNEIPSGSYLSFAADSTGHLNSRLHAYEIAQMNLENELVVLSACETNKSSNNEGDGLLGIARAFQLASCPNIIMSNWLVNDKSASHIVYDCLEKIKSGLDTPSALREAKLKYINENPNMYNHPTFWAGFTYYGQYEKVVAESSFSYKWFAVGACAFILLVLIDRLFKKK